MDRKTMIERLEWLANEGYGNEMPDWLAPNVWGKSVAELATAALDTMGEMQRILDNRLSLFQEAADRKALAAFSPTGWPVWRPIAEAPIPPPDGLPEYWMWSCLLQDDRGGVGEGFARYVHMRYRGRQPGPSVLRWYRAGNGGVWPNVKYFMPLPAKRED